VGSSVRSTEAGSSLVSRAREVGRERIVEGGLGFGSAIAMILSFQLNHSIWYMILHGICSWFYVLWRAYEGNY
jgi:hypothetical protein